MTGSWVSLVSLCMALAGDLSVSVGKTSEQDGVAAVGDKMGEEGVSGADIRVL